MQHLMYAWVCLLKRCLWKVAHGIIGVSWPALSVGHLPVALCEPCLGSLPVGSDGSCPPQQISYSLSTLLEEPSVLDCMYHYPGPKYHCWQTALRHKYRPSLSTKVRTVVRNSGCEYEPCLHISLSLFHSCQSKGQFRTHDYVTCKQTTYIHVLKYITQSIGRTNFKE